MFDDDTSAFLAGGCSLIIGSVDDDGEPRATRGWGLIALDDAGRRFRLVLDGLDASHPEHYDAGRPIAVTATDVPTLRSMQLKGTIVSVDSATAADETKADQFCDDFFRDIHDTEGTALELLDRLAPPTYAACIIDIDEVYDQTPGPKAGSAIAGAAAITTDTDSDTDTDAGRR